MESANEPKTTPPEHSSPRTPKQTEKRYGQKELIQPRQTEAD